MSDLIVLMYHALYASERELESIAPEDRPYAVSLEHFRLHLQALQGGSTPIVDLAEAVTPLAGSARRLLLSFDDGHESNCRLALPELQARNLKAVFFVTAEFIGRRHGFCSPGQLRELSAAGMAVQAHGLTHRFFDTLADDDARAEVRDSRRAIEDATGRVVTAMSFPGGRYNRRSIAIGRAEGITHFFGSMPGINHTVAVARERPLCRFAVRARTTADEITRLGYAHPATVARLVAVAKLKAAARALVGSRAYHRVYQQRTNRR